jgi:type VI secretion system Hcp family effector
MKISTLRLASLLSLTLIVIPAVRGQTSTSLDMFLTLDDVKGSSTDSSFKDAMVVLDFSYAITNVGAGSLSGKALAGDLVMTKTMDQSSPVLAQAAASGMAYKKAVLTVRRPDKGEQKPFYIITLSDVRVDAVSQMASAIKGLPAYPMTETLALTYGKAEWAQGNTKAGRDFAGNKNAGVETNSAPHHIEASVSSKSLAASFPASPLK